MTLLDDLVGGDRRALARALTLAESSRADHRQQTAELLAALPAAEPSLRLGITGPPGAGKSTLIEQLGLAAIEAGHRVGVLAIDPSSERTGGSILGDKTRMEQLSRHDSAFVRPSPAAGALGGVARRTRQALRLLEAAGYDRVLVETVGVGQSEQAVAHLVDTVLLLALPGAGDELQGMKRGLMEMADVVWVNKAEADRLPLARLAANSLSLALRLLSTRTPGWSPRVELGSALQPTDAVRLWAVLEEHWTFVRPELERRRGEQGAWWLERDLEELLRQQFFADPDRRARWTAAREQVRAGLLTPEGALADLFPA